jgi:hypothetical protein
MYILSALWTSEHEVLYPPRNYWSDVSQMLSGSGRVDSTSLFEGVRTWRWLCNLIFIDFSWVFINNEKLGKRRRLSRHRCCGWTREMNSGRPVPETARSWVSCVWSHTELLYIAATQNKDPFITHALAAQVSTHLVPNKQNRLKERDNFLWYKVPNWNENLTARAYENLRNGCLTCVT